MDLRLYLICHLCGGSRPAAPRQGREGGRLQRTHLCSGAVFLLYMCGGRLYCSVFRNLSSELHVSWFLRQLLLNLSGESQSQVAVEPEG